MKKHETFYEIARHLGYKEQEGPDDSMLAKWYTSIKYKKISRLSLFDFCRSIGQDMMVNC